MIDCDSCGKSVELGEFRVRTYSNDEGQSIELSVCDTCDSYIDNELRDDG